MGERRLASPELGDKIETQEHSLAAVNPDNIQVSAHAEMLRAIFETAVDCIITIDDKGIIESVNPAVQRHFGYSPDELLGKNVSVLMPSPDRERHDGYLHRYHETGEPRIIGSGREVLAQRKDGSTFAVYLAVSEMKFGGQRKYAGILHDISDRRRYEESLRQRALELRATKEGLEQAARAKDQFIAMLSHELRTPLTPALAMLSLMETESDMGEGVRDALTTIRRNIELEARLIDDLLDLTRISRGKVHLNAELVDAHAVLEDSIEICRSEIEVRGHRIVRDFRATSVQLEADPARLRQVFWNIIKNAVKFTPREGQIAIRTWNNQNAFVTEPNDPPVVQETFVVSITDSGVGINRSVLPRIFNAFEQASLATTRQFGGLGLGLAITKALVELHSGQISAHSEGEGMGATFTMHFPTVDAARRSEAVASPRSGSAAATRPMHILLVEDHPDTLKAVTLLLRRAGHSVDDATSVADAKMKLDQQYDLVISDIGLPDDTGLAVMRYATAKWPGIRGVALSGYGMEDDVRRSHEAGFHEHLTKPIDFATLKQAVARAAGALAVQGNPG